MAKILAARQIKHQRRFRVLKHSDLNQLTVTDMSKKVVYHIQCDSREEYIVMLCHFVEKDWIKFFVVMGGLHND